jgi:hypothetical protein
MRKPIALAPSAERGQLRKQFCASLARSRFHTTSTPTGHQRGLPVSLFDKYDAATKSGGSMRSRASIGIALLALSQLVSANASSALAQAGSTGGTVGKQDKSISGSEEADRPRAAPFPKKRSAASTHETSSGRSCNRIVGTWSWYLGVSDVIFHKDSSAMHPASGATGKWSCAGDTVNVVWSYQGTLRTDRMTLSQDGNSIFVVSPYGGGIKFTGTRRGQ